MSQEDRKVLRILTIYGGDISILTRMPVKEIEAEIYNMAEERDPDFMKFVGINEVDDIVDIAFVRAHLSGYVLKRYTPKQIAT